MVRTPEQYFEDQDFGLPQTAESVNLTAAEQSFLKKYVSAEGASELGLVYTESGDVVLPDVPPLEEELKTREKLQMIFFYVQEQIYAIPIEAVQEVINFIQPMRLPLTPDYMSGIINLRGRVTPILHLEQMLCVKHNPIKTDCLIMVCQRKGIQVGVIIDSIYNMHIVDSSKVSWNVEAQIGANGDYLCGILDYDDKIHGIISIDKIVDYII